MLRHLKKGGHRKSGKRVLGLGTKVDLIFLFVSVQRYKNEKIPAIDR